MTRNTKRNHATTSTGAGVAYWGGNWLGTGR